MLTHRSQWSWLLAMQVGERRYFPFPPELLALLETQLHERQPQRTDAECIRRWRSPITGGIAYAGKCTGRRFESHLHPSGTWKGAMGLVVERLPDR